MGSLAALQLPPGFFTHLKDAATSPLAFVAYVTLVIAWGVVAFVKLRPASKANEILREYETDAGRGQALEQIIGAPVVGKLDEKGVREHLQLHYAQKTRQILLIGYLGTLAAVVLIVVALFSTAKAEPLKDDTPDLVAQVSGKDIGAGWPESTLQALTKLHTHPELITPAQKEILKRQFEDGIIEINKIVADQEQPPDESELENLVRVNRALASLIGDQPSWKDAMRDIELRIPGFLKSRHFTP